MQSKINRKGKIMSSKKIRLIAMIGAAGLLFGSGTAAVKAEGEEIQITVQPESQEYSYPDPVSFHVEVNHPEKIVSYQWYMTDNAHIFQLDGTSAKTDTLERPSTDYTEGALYYWCEMADEDGNIIKSDQAELVCDNYDERFPLLYISDYAVLAGDTIDLAEYGLGSGKISLASDGSEVTLDHVNMTNLETSVYDGAFRPTPGLMMMDRSCANDEYHIRMVGDCVIDNRWYAEDVNSGGVTLNTYVAAAYHEKYPAIILEGDPLTLRGGLNTYYSDTDLIIDTDVTFEAVDNHICESVYAGNIRINSGRTVTINTTGEGIEAIGNLVIEDGAAVIANMAPAHNPGRPTSYGTLMADDDLYIGKANVEINVAVDPEEYLPTESLLVAFNGLWAQGTATLSGSTVAIKMYAPEAAGLYALNLNALRGPWNGSLHLTDGAAVNVNMATDAAADPTVAFYGGDVTIDGGASLTASLRGIGNAYGIYCNNGTLTVNDGILDVTVDSLEAYDSQRDCVGVRAANINIDLKDSKNLVHINSISGLSMIAGCDGTLTGSEEYVEGYEPEKFIISEDTLIRQPANGEINRFTYRIPRQVPVEIIYDKDTGEPVHEVLLTGAKSSIDFSSDYYEIVYGKQMVLIPHTDAEGQITFTSSDDSIVSCENGGNLLHANGVGTAVITATAEDGSTGSCTVRVLFTDVADSQKYFFNPVYWAFDKKITVGHGGAGKFSPDAPCTREQIVTFLWRLMGEPEPQGESNFTDVAEDAWYYAPITWASENGITVGLNDGTGRFGVGQACTREQCVTFLHRAAGKPEVTEHQEFTDVEEGRYYYDAISWAASNQITVGLNDGTGRFGVGQKCTRAMIVTFLSRYNDTLAPAVVSQK